MQYSLQSKDRIVCLPVVGKEFCSPLLTILTVRKKPLVFSEGGLTVTESSTGQIVFRVEGRGPSSKNRLVLMDSLGKPLLTLRRKGFAMCNHWWGFSGEKYDGQEPIFSVKKPLIFSKSGDMEVFLGPNIKKKQADYTVQGSYKERYCKIYNGTTTIVAEVKRKFATSDVMLSRDVFSVVVKMGVDQAFIMGLIVILHQISGENDEFSV
ncbi:hypothetical protein SUGI_0219190 [Cryptomeria japonica]|nr:hypothetical protein SUGI_0219190 [Cryptomeria japonica]